MKSIRTRLEIVGEILGFFAANRQWWLLPTVIVLIALSIVLVAVQATTLAPFIYPLF